MKYFTELSNAMKFLNKFKKTIFIGQAVSYAGTGMTNTLKDVSKKKKLELPVAEEMQMGMTLGLAMEGFIPISIYPRWNFLILALNQLVNHVDKLNEMGNGGFENRIIIRTGIGSVRPLNPQSQHDSDFTSAVQIMCRNIDIIRLEDPKDIMPAYKKAILRKDKKPTILVEYGDYYNEK
tara:strand:- start:414 stop:950 length:537 start_codon:yes stop_codon:yes gene_type:complete